jgi:tight adherence protein B
MSPQILIAGLVAAGVAGVGLALTSGSTNAEKRMSAVGREERKAVVTTLDRAAKKKQVATSLKEMDRKRGNGRANLDAQLLQAGLSTSKQQFIIYSALLGAFLGGMVWLKTQNLYVGAAFLLIGGLGVPRFVLGRLKKRRVKKFIEHLPSAIDIIVRGVRSGLPLGDTIRIVANEGNEPVKSEFRRIVEAQTVGLPLTEAVERLTQRVPITETNFFSIVIAIQSKAGGNLSEALGNLSKVLRERKAMKGKIGAMAMEATASAAIIGAVPFVVTGMLYMSSPSYISLLWTTSHGRMASVVAMIWMSIGTAMMKKMINFDF